MGDCERVVLVRFGKEGPRDVEVMRRRGVLGVGREGLEPVDDRHNGRGAKL
jgi:hypothetical protein